MIRNKKELNKRVEKIVNKEIKRAVGKCGVDKLEHIKLRNSHVDIEYVKAILNAAYNKVEIDDLTDENYIHITCDDTREVLLQKFIEGRYYVRKIF